MFVAFKQVEQERANSGETQVLVMELILLGNGMLDRNGTDGFSLA